MTIAATGTGNVPAQYRTDIDDARRQLIGCAPEAGLARFQAVADEYLRWVTVGGLDEPLVFGDLLRAAADAGLAEEEARDALNDALVLVRRNTGKNHTKIGWRSRCMSAATLREEQFPPIAFVVPGLIPEGVTILAGKPKIGKSWLALDICVAVAAGRTCLGDAAPIEGDVLYAALEDNHRRLQRRLSKLMGNEPWPGRLTLATAWRRLDEGGVADFDGWVAQVPSPRLVVIDTLAAVRPQRPNIGYREDYEALSELQGFAGDRGIAVIVLHHLRKMSADDPLDTVSGTLGLTGSADTTLVLARGTSGMTLYGRGRDIEEIEYAIDFDSATCRWTILGDADDVKRSEQRQAILVALGDVERGAGDIATATCMTRGNVDRLLHSMLKDGEVERPRRGAYRRAPRPR